MTDHKEIATTILNQLGGMSTLKALTGAHTFVIVNVADSGVYFRIKNRKGPNHIKILLTSKDLYDVTFGRVHGTSYKVLSEHEDIYADQLVPLFENETGMYLSF